MQQPYWPFGPGEKEQWERLLKERPDLAPAVEKLADTYKQRRRERGVSRGVETIQGGGENHTMPPPKSGANDDRKKEAQSKICRTPDGDAPWLELANTYRSERLQALGNGVCPLTAALAFSVLWERMKENE